MFFARLSVVDYEQKMLNEFSEDQIRIIEEEFGFSASNGARFIKLYCFKNNMVGRKGVTVELEISMDPSNKCIRDILPLKEIHSIANGFSGLNSNGERIWVERKETVLRKEKIHTKQFKALIDSLEDYIYEGEEAWNLSN